jgi:hypothetical protein
MLITTTPVLGTHPHAHVCVWCYLAAVILTAGQRVAQLSDLAAAVIMVLVAVVEANHLRVLLLLLLILVRLLLRLLQLLSTCLNKVLLCILAPDVFRVW